MNLYELTLSLNLFRYSQNRISNLQSHRGYKDTKLTFAFNLSYIYITHNVGARARISQLKADDPH